MRTKSRVASVCKTHPSALEAFKRLCPRSAKAKSEIGDTFGGTNPLASLTKYVINDPN